MENMTMERPRLKDFFEAFRDIIGGQSSKYEKELNKKLRRVYNVQDEIGATESIVGLESSLKEQIKPISKVKDTIKKVATKKPVQRKAEEIDQEPIIREEKDLEK